MSDENGWGFMGTLLGLAVFAVALLVYLVEANECSKTGGVFVQDAFWYSCVEPHR